MPRNWLYHGVSIHTLFLSIAISHILPSLFFHPQSHGLLSPLPPHLPLRSYLPSRAPFSSSMTYIYTDTESSQAEETRESPHEKKNQVLFWVAYFTARRFPVASFPLQIPLSRSSLEPAGTSVCTRNTRSLPAHLWPVVQRPWMYTYPCGT